MSKLSKQAQIERVSGGARIQAATALSLNAAPVATGMAGDVAAYTEAAAPVLLDVGSNAGLTDADSTNFDGGSLTVSITGNEAASEDVLGIVAAVDGSNQNTPIVGVGTINPDGSASLVFSPGGVGVSLSNGANVGSLVYVEGIHIGTVTSGGSGGADLTVSFNGSATPAAVAQLLQSLSYSNSNTGNPSTAPRTVTISVSDGDGGAPLQIQTTVTVSGVNDAPTLTTPVTRVPTEDVASAITGITVADVDAGSGAVTVTLSVPQGTLAAVSGAGVTVGGTASALTLTGTVAAINTFIAASSVTYLSALNAGGTVILTVTVNDGGHNGSGGALSAQKTINLNILPSDDAPVVQLPTAPSIQAGAVQVFSDAGGNAVTISDADGAFGTYTVTISVAEGTLTLGSTANVTVVGDGGSTVVVTGVLSDINAALDGLSYHSTAQTDGTVVLNISTVDHAAAGENLIVNPGAEDGDAAGDWVSAILPDGWDGVAGGTTAVQYGIGDETQLNWDDSDATDGGSHYFAGGPNSISTIAQTIDVSGSAALIDAGGLAVLFGGLLGGLGAENDCVVMNLLFLDENGFPIGSVELDGAMADERGEDSQLLAASGSVSVPAGARQIAVTLTFKGGTGGYNDGYADNLFVQLAPTGLSTLNMSVTSPNQAPAGADDEATINEDSTYTFSADDFPFSDSDGDGFAGVTIITGPGNGKMWFDADGAGGAAPVQVQPGVGGYFVSAEDLAAGKLTYVPDSNESGTLHDSFTFAVRDDGGTLDGGVHQDPNPDTFIFNVTTNNDAPVLTPPDFTNFVTENVAGPIFSSDSVVFSDVDSADYAGGSLTVAKSSAIETLALRTTGAVTLSAGMTAGSVVSVNGVAVGVIAIGGTGAGADNLVISLNANATAARMSILVKELTYVSTENNPSFSKSVTITLVDGDGRANGGDDDGSVTIGFYVNPVNDDPTLTSPVGLTADENGVVTLTGFTIADIDSSGIFYVSLMTPTGAYTAPSVDGVSAVVNGQYLSLSGTLAAINAYLAAGKASVTLPAGSASDTTLQVQVSDGSGGSAFSLVPVEDSFAGPAAISLMLGGNDQAIADSQGFSSLAALPDGGYVLAWTNNGEIAVRRFNTDGTPIDAQQQVNTYTTGAQFWTSVTVLTDGGFVVTWMSAAQDGSGYGVYGQRFDADGDKAGAEFRINTYTTWDQMAPSVTALTGGGFVVTWLSAGQDGGSYGVYAQRYTNGGAAAGGEFRVTSTTAPDQSLPNVTALAGGGFVVVWYSAGQDGSDSAVYGRRFAADGTALAAEFQVNTYTTGDQGYDASVGALEDGGFVVVWTSEGQDGSGGGIYAQRYTAGGVKVGGEFRVNTYTADDQDSGNVVGLSDGGFIVTWTSMGQDGESGGLYAQRYDVDGQPVGTEFRVNQTPAGYQYTDGHSPGVTVTETEDGSIVFTWYGMGDVYVRQFTPTDFAGVEDTALALHLGLNTTEAEETIASVTLSGLPQGAVLSAGTDNGDGSWTLTAAQVEGLTLTPPLNYNGSFDLTVTVVTQDGVSTETSSATQTVTVSAVNDAPAVSAPDSIDVEGATAITGVSVSDVDAGGAVVVATLSVPSGSLAAVSGSGVTVGGTASALTLTGTIANINAFIAASKVVFTPEPGNVADPTLTISVNDGGSSGTGGAQTGGDTVTLVVPDENLPPSIGSSTISVTEDTPTAITGLSFSDPDAGTDPIVVTLSVPAGALAAGSADGVTVGGTASALTLTGSVAAINAFIAGGAVIYTPAENASADVTLSVHADDQGHNGPPGVNTAEEEVTLDLQPVNDAPEITGPVGVGSTEDSPLPLTSITISDVDAGSSPVTLTLSVPAGSLAATSGAGVTVGGTAAAMTLTGTATAINAFIAASKVVYTPVLNSSADVTVTATVTDNGHAGSGGALEDSTSWTVTLSAVNDAPTASAPASVGVTEDVASAMTGISFADVDAGMATVTVTLSVPTGSLAAGPGDGTVTVGGTASALTLTGTIGHINAFIAASNVSYTTAENATANVTLTAVINDGGATGMSGALSGQTTTVLTVSAVNDAPVVSVPGSATVTEDVAGAVTGISFSDVDAASGAVTATLSVPSGSLAATSGSGVTVGGTASALTLTGTVANINAFIAASGVTYTTAQNATGSVTATAAIDDGGHTGSGGSRTDSAQFTIDVTAVNDAPTASAPPSIAVTEDVASAVTGISFADADVGSATVTATLSVPSGTLAATSGGGVTVGGTASALTLTGTVAAINAFIAASGVTYTTVQNATADVALTASLNDGGNSGTGGAQSGQTTATLAVTAVNDAPTVALPSDVEGVPGTPKALTGLVISDVDAGSGTVTATISAPAGTFTATSGAGVGVAGSGTSTLTLSGTVAAINAFIAAGGVAFNPSTASGASVVVTLSVDDGGNGGVDPGLSGTATSEAVSAGFTVSLLIPITGTGGSDGLTGGSRNEFLDAGEGDDKLSGGGGDDRLDGGTGDDRLDGGTGADQLNGGDGIDTVVYGSSAVTVNLQTGVNAGHAAGDTFSSIERYTLSSAGDQFIGSNGDDWVDGLAGNDTLNGGLGADTLIGSGGLDKLYGGAGTDTLSGGNENDQLYGGADADVLEGGFGSDLIEGGAGADMLTGGVGADTFVFGADAVDGSTDRVLDFQKLVDKIDLRAIDANTLVGGDQAFSFVNGGLTGQAGQAALSYTAGTNTTTVLLDVNGDGIADLTILVTGQVGAGDWWP